jgi:hypothetical protein
MIYGTKEFGETLKAIMKDGERHPLYEESVKHAEEMGVHVYGDKPDFLLRRARPHEDDEVQAYRIENYEPLTKAGSDKAIEIVSKIFNPTLYSIVWKDQSAEVKELHDYLFVEYPIYNSVTNFDKDVLLRKMIADPNGVIAIAPERMPKNDLETINPISFLYSSKNVYWFDHDCFLIFISEEEIDSQKHFHFIYFDRNQIIHFESWWDEASKSVFIEEEEIPYNHGFNEIPVWFLRGKSKATGNGSIIFESFFSSALPHWNTSVSHESDLLGAYIKHLHPQKMVWTDECQHEFTYDSIIFKCINGAMKSHGRTGVGHPMENTDCSKCGGSGRIAVTSPYGEYQISKSKLETDQYPAGLKPVEYIHIPVDATKMLEERTEKFRKEAMYALNMDVEEKIGAIQSGVAKQIDRTAQQDFLFNIGAVVFDVHLTNQIYFSNKYKFAIRMKSENKTEEKNLPDVVKPTQFDVLTTAELINNFAVASKSGVDKNYLRVKQMEIVNRDLNNSPEMKKYLLTMLMVDPLFGFVQDEISSGVNAGVIQKRDWAIHENLKPFLDRAIDEDKKFLDKPLKEKVDKMNQYGDELVKANKPQVDTNLLLMNDAA